MQTFFELCKSYEEFLEIEKKARQYVYINIDTLPVEGFFEALTKAKQRLYQENVLNFYLK